MLHRTKKIPEETPPKEGRQASYINPVADENGEHSYEKLRHTNTEAIDVTSHDEINDYMTPVQRNEYDEIDDKRVISSLENASNGYLTPVDSRIVSSSGNDGYLIPVERGVYDEIDDRSISHM